MQNQLYREIIRQLVAQELLTIEDGQLYLDGELISEDPEQGEYRADGWSHETSRGCRRHRLIDEKLDELEAGDAVEQRVASWFARWYCFHPMQLAGFTDQREWVEAGPSRHPVEAEDELERLMAAEAAMQLPDVLWMLARNDASFPYPVREDSDGDGVEEDRVLRDHKVVVAADDPVEEIAERWPAQLVASIDRTLARMGR